MNTFYVQIIRYSDDEVVSEMGPFTERKAERVDNGANINLNHNEFYTVIIDEADAS